MLNLFGKLFDRSDEGGAGLPAPLIKKLVERAVDGTDPRLRIVSGYAKTLRRPVVHAAGHVIGLIDALPEPMPLEPGGLHACPTLEVLLYSGAQAQQILARDTALADFRKSHPAGPVFALLVVQRSEKRGFGIAQVGEQTLKDVPQTTVSFSNHHLLEPAATEEDCRRGLKRRAFDHVLAVALARLSEHQEVRKDLSTRRALLRSKLDILQRGGGFAKHTGGDDRAKLQARLAEIEEQLAAQGPVDNVLEAHLDIIAEVLAQAEQHLWLEEHLLSLDRLYVLREQAAPSVPQISCRDLHNSEGERVMLQLVQLA